MRTAFCLLLLIAFSATHAAEPVVFNRDIRPIFSDNCFACHGFDAKKRKAKLRLDTEEGAYRPNEDGVAAIKPGDLAGSDAWVRILSTDPDEQMPPPKSHKKLTPQQRDLIKRWIEQGAKYQRHWAFEPPVRAGPQTLDGFIRARLEQEKLAPSPEADRETLIRRVTFALTGLPPTPAEAQAFAADQAPGAYEKVAERLLASPRYGEQMARSWLDQARYGDTHGLHLDNERSMWPYRDWVIKAFNDNQRFDQFTIEQLAGDLLPNATQTQLVASGFNRCNVTTSEGGAIDAEYIFLYALDRTATTANTWMGLTAQCAVCHDHKFDPISQREFYQLYAFFHSAADPAMDGNALLTKPTLKLATPEQEARLAEFDAKTKDVQARIAAALAQAVYADPGAIEPRPPAQEIEEVWLDDDFPAGAKVTASPGQPTQFATAADGQVFSGTRALKRTDKGLAQDFYEGGAAPLEVPPSGKFFAHVFLDPGDVPKTIMLQFNKGGWEHRAVWGDYGAIQWGKAGTAEKFNAGPLPNTGQWVRLEVEAEKLGFKPGDKIAGLAYTQFGGTVYWDKAGVAGRKDPAANPAQSQLAWEKAREGKDSPELPQELNKILKSVARKDRKPEHEKQLRDYYLANVCAATKAAFEPMSKELATRKKEQEAFDATIPSTFIMGDMEKPRESFIMLRGQYDKPGEKVTRNVPAALPPLPDATKPTRLDLARWLVSDTHPLTARVTVNRLWQQIFGVGLVKTSGDFGSQGDPPSHPELLDWLAVTFRESGWDVKALVRMFVTSATFRQSSQAAPAMWQRDPENRLLARGPRFRLDAEEIRDNALFVSGLLNPQMGGKGVNPYQPPNIWEPVGFVGSNTREYKQDKGDALYRRSIYTFFKRTAPPPFMTTFDAPSREQFCTRRERSDTPLQALQLMNDVQHFEAARTFAQRMMTEGGASPAERIAWGFRSVLARRPTDAETATVQEAFAKHLAKYQAAPEAAKQAIRNGESQPKPGLPEPELAAWTLVANLLLNLDETITRN